MLKTFLLTDWRSPFTEGAAKLKRHKFYLSRRGDCGSDCPAGRVRRKLDHATELLGHCQIVAPQDGMVVYQITRGTRAGGFEFEARATARERQILVRLANQSQLQLKLYVDEANIDLLRVGQAAAIKVDAFPDKTNTGRVTVVSVVAEPPNRAESDARQYAVIVSLDDPPAQAKLGLTATAEIKVRAEKIGSVRRLTTPILHNLAGAEVSSWARNDICQTASGAPDGER